LWRDYSAGAVPAMEQYRETVLNIGTWLFSCDSGLLDDLLPFRHVVCDQRSQDVRATPGSDQPLLGQRDRDGRRLQKLVDRAVDAYPLQGLVERDVGPGRQPCLDSSLPSARARMSMPVPGE
jgi:hypothetical protein